MRPGSTPLLQALLRVLESSRPLTLDELHAAVGGDERGLSVGDVHAQLLLRKDRFNCVEVAGSSRWTASDWTQLTRVGTAYAVLPQLARRPTTSALSNGAWGPLLASIAAALEDVATDIVVLRVTSQGRTTLEMQLGRVLDSRPWWIATMVVRSRRMGLLAESARWHLWDPALPVDWNDRRRLRSAPDITHALPVATTWRAETPVHLRWAVHALLRDTLELQPQRIGFSVERCDDDEAHRRRRRLTAARTESAAYDASGRFVSVAKATCRMCGRPLSRPESVSMGIGPECHFRLREPMLRIMHRAPAVPLQYWVGALPIAQWRVRVERLLAD